MAVKEEGISNPAERKTILLAILGLVLTCVGIVVAIIPLVDEEEPPLCEPTYVEIETARAEVAQLAGVRTSLMSDIGEAESIIERANARLERLEGFLHEHQIQLQMRKLHTELKQIYADFSKLEVLPGRGLPATKMAEFSEALAQTSWPSRSDSRRTMRLRFEDATSFDGTRFYKLFDFGLRPDASMANLIAELERAAYEHGPYADRMWRLGHGLDRIENGAGEAEIATLQSERSAARNTLISTERELLKNQSALRAKQDLIISLTERFDALRCAGSEGAATRLLLREPALIA